LRDQIIHPWQYPLLDEGQAGWIMKKLVYKIKKTYYEERSDYVGPRQAFGRFNPMGLDHQRDDCEACSLGRCPRFKMEADSNMRKGRQGNNQNNLEHIVWVLIDENNHVYDL
jgi:hypothetical protein